MCGIAGLIDFKKNRISNKLLADMIACLVHRGPDDQGLWIEHNIGLAHARLSIHDLSPAGQQPMYSFDQRFIIVFNGEIYNYKALRKDLQREFQINFKSDSDTEVLVNALCLWGINKTLVKCVGMFAFAAWDTLEKKFFLARDRFGEKPLYYGIQKGVLGFASELKSLRLLRPMSWTFEIDKSALSQLLQFGYISAPLSIYQGIKKLSPGRYMEINLQGNIIERTYWDASVIALQSYQNQIEIDWSEAVCELESKLLESVKLQKEADVPIGAFLSGGVDSSIMVALMQSISNQSVKTFSIGFLEEKYNEASFAKAVANYLKTDHTEIYLPEIDAMKIVPEMADIYDEPFSDASQIPTYLVSRIAKKDVTVCISGDGGDELFGGYNAYFKIAQVWQILSHFPKKMWPLLASLLKVCPSSLKIKNILIGDKLHKLSNVLKRTVDQTSLYQNFLSIGQVSDQLILNENANNFECNMDDSLDGLDFQSWMMLMDTQRYLTNDILTKVDRAAMSVSLETRIPLLDHRIYEFIWQLPKVFKIKGNEGKRILKEVLYRYVPKDLIDRPKKGFSVPYGEWLCYGLKEWAEDLLQPDYIVRQGILDAACVSTYWNEHLTGKRNWKAVLWNILMFQSWYKKFH